MSHIPAHRAESAGTDISVHRGADIADPVADLYRREPPVKALFGGRNEGFCLFADPTDREGTGTVSVIERSHIHLDDIPFFENPFLAGNTVNDFIIDADAGGSGEPVKSQERRPGTATLDVVTDHFIQLLGTDALPDMLSGDEQCLARDDSGLPHGFDLCGIFDFNHFSNRESASNTRRVVSATSL